jgi:hypothetical protein
MSASSFPRLPPTAASDDRMGRSQTLHPRGRSRPQSQPEILRPPSACAKTAAATINSDPPLTRNAAPSRASLDARPPAKFPRIRHRANDRLLPTYTLDHRIDDYLLRCWPRIAKAQNNRRSYNKNCKNQEKRSDTYSGRCTVTLTRKVVFRHIFFWQMRLVNICWQQFV